MVGGISCGETMKKIAYFDTHWGDGWPDLLAIERFFISRPGFPRLAGTRLNDASLGIQGVDGTDELQSGKGRIDISLDIDAVPEHGALLFYRKWGGGLKESFWSRGNVSRLGETARNAHGTLLPIGLFISFEDAWLAVKEFVERDGVLPRSIEWIRDSDLPPGVFPSP